MDAEFAYGVATISVFLKSIFVKHCKLSDALIQAISWYKNRKKGEKDNGINI